MKNIIPFGKPFIGLNECREVVNTLKSGILVHGKSTKKFEEELEINLSGILDLSSFRFSFTNS